MNLSDSRTAGQAEPGQPAASQHAAAGERPATSGAVPRPATAAEPAASRPAAVQQPERPAQARPAAVQQPTPSAAQAPARPPAHPATAHPVTAPIPLARLSAAEAVFNAIRQDIESGAIEVGTKLRSEANLASQYGVSRSVIREALRSCTALGLTVTKTGKGTFVVANRVANDLSLGQYSARDLNEARPHIEVPAAGLAAQRRTAEELEHLKDIVKSMLKESDPEAWVNLDASLHSAIARASGNKVFESVVADIRDALTYQSETLNMVADRQHASDREHLRIVDAIEKGDADSASAAMAAHLSAVAEALDTILSK